MLWSNFVFGLKSSYFFSNQCKFIFVYNTAHLNILGYLSVINFMEYV